MLIDTHCHLDEQYFPGGPDSVLSRARDAEVFGFIVIGVGDNLAPARAAVALGKQRPNDVAAAVGIHPHDAKTLTDPAYGELSTLARDPCVVAVGEIGLDYHYERSPRDVQRATFARLIALARELKKPIVVHTRAAPAETLSLLESENARDVGGVIHCFSEDCAFAERALNLNFDLSFSGIVTFKNAKTIQDVAAWAPLDRILVETDSPYLAPVPMRGKPCEPAYVVHTARHIAALKGLPFEQIASTTTENAKRRFQLRFAP